MNVRDLIKVLQELDPTGNLLVVVDGYEYGFDLVKEAQVIDVVKICKPREWAGDYVKATDYAEAGTKIMRVVYLPRTSC